MGTTLFAISSAVGLEAVDRAVDWVAASSGVNNSAYSVAAALVDVSGSMFTMTFLVFWLALVFLAIGMVLSSAIPKWLGWALLVPSAAVVVIAIIRFFTDPTQATEYIFAVPGRIDQRLGLGNGHLDHPQRDPANVG